MALLGGVLLAAAFRGGDYVERFKQYPWKRIQASDRYQMAAAALRAWRTVSPVFGIGPGMHQNLWPHFAASPDGDREKGKWPTHPNNTFHSYEVHSDWTQLLEEYGAVGLALFLAAAGGGLAVLLKGRALALTRMRRCGEPTPYYWQIQGAIFAAAAMAFHSIGDFNLQMPATVWMLAAIVSMPMAHVLRDSRERTP
jgi:O-antigen ligase